MKHAPCFIIYLFYILLSNTTIGQIKPDAYQSYFQQNTYLKQWADHIPHFKLSAFNYSSTIDFENSSIDTGPLNNDKNFQETFGKLISYSPDKKKYLDFYSGQFVFDTLRTDGKQKLTVSADIDQYLFLGDYVTHQRTRILFNGSTSALEEAVWISDNAFILVGTTREGESFYPFIYIGDVKKRQLHYYLPDNKNIKRDTIYHSPRWKQIKG
jgi:hypothetical protein